MAKIGWGIAAAVLVMSVGGIAPASAEFFGCKEPRTTVSYSTPRVTSPFRGPSQRHYTQDYSRTRHAAMSSWGRSDRQWR